MSAPDEGALRRLIDAAADLPEGERLPHLVRAMAAMPEPERALMLRRLPVHARRMLHEHWPAWAHPGQMAAGDDWAVWLIRAGRGFGKTRAGAEWVQAYARANATARIALVGGSVADVAQVMVEGASGLIATTRHGDTWKWRREAGEFTFGSGAKAFVYSAEAPEKLRGPEHDAAWCDELAKWRYGEATWNNLRLGLRLGDRPQVVVTTTPRPTALMRTVMTTTGAVETRGGTRDNPHLSDTVQQGFVDTYAGTRLGRQELDGEMIDDIAGALWTRALLERQRVVGLRACVRVVVGVDPPAGSEGDACGIVAVGLGEDGHGYVLEDASVAGASPEGWARAVADCAIRHGADRVVAEKNQGGDMVGSVLRAADAAMPFRLVHAIKAKGARAEPVAALYEHGRMWHLGMFAALEDELCGLTPAGYEGAGCGRAGYGGAGRSPDRADALVWAASFLLLGERTAEAGVRVIR